MYLVTFYHCWTETANQRSSFYLCEIMSIFSSNWLLKWTAEEWKPVRRWVHFTHWQRNQCTWNVYHLIKTKSIKRSFSESNTPLQLMDHLSKPNKKWIWLRAFSEVWEGARVNDFPSLQFDKQKQWKAGVVLMQQIWKCLTRQSLLLPLVTKWKRQRESNRDLTLFPPHVKKTSSFIAGKSSLVTYQ